MNLAFTKEKLENATYVLSEVLDVINPLYMNNLLPGLPTEDLVVGIKDLRLIADCMEEILACIADPTRDQKKLLELTFQIPASWFHDFDMMGMGIVIDGKMVDPRLANFDFWKEVDERFSADDTVEIGGELGFDFQVLQGMLEALRDDPAIPEDETVDFAAIERDKRPGAVFTIHDFVNAQFIDMSGHVIEEAVQGLQAVGFKVEVIDRCAIGIHRAQFHTPKGFFTIGEVGDQPPVSSNPEGV